MTLRSTDQIAIDARLALVAGDRARARQLAQQALSLDATNEMAWLVLAALASGERRKAYLEHVLQLHPLSRAAKVGLESLAQQPPVGETGRPERRGLAPGPSSTQPIPQSVREAGDARPPAGRTQPIPKWEGTAPPEGSTEVPGRPLQKTQRAIPAGGTPPPARADAARRARRSPSRVGSPFWRALAPLGRWSAAAAATLLVIAYLTLFGLTMADRGRNGLPAEPLQAAGAAIVQVTEHLFDHPETYIWHKAETPALTVVSEVFGHSAGLLLASLLIAALIGVPLGIAAATARGRLGSAPLLVLSIIGISTPSFLLAMLLWVVDIWVYRRTNVLLFPPTGFGWDTHIILPALVLAGRPIAQLAQVTYVTFNDLLQQDFVRTARGKGIRWGLVLSRHVLRNAVVPILTTLGTSLRFSLASLPVVEIFFVWPGVGSTLLETIVSGNDALVTDLIVSLGLFFLLVNVAIEVAFPLIDPRLRAERLTEVRADRFSLRESLRSLAIDVIGGVRSVVSSITPQPGRRRVARRRQTVRAATLTSPNGMPRPAARGKWMRRVFCNPALLVGGLLVVGLAVLVLTGEAFTGATAYTTHGVRMIEGVIQAPPFQPSALFPWGSDMVGRDVQALVLAGARQTMILAVFATLARMALGALLGALAGWWRGSWFDRLLTGAVGVWAAFPVTLFAMVLIYALGIKQGMWVFIVALCLVGWGEVAQAVRAKVVSIRAEPFIEGARSLGARSWQILWREALPNLVPSLIVLGVLEMGGVLMLLAELGFLNVFLGGGYMVEMAPTGRQITTYFYSDVPEWGAMLANIRNVWRAYPWMGWYPGVAFFLSILGFNLLGEGVRHLLDDIHFAVTRLVNRYTVAASLAVGLVLVMLIQSTTPLGVYRDDALRFDGQRALTDAAALSAPYFQGRESGRAGAKLAAEYIAQRMREVGLFPLVTQEQYLLETSNPRPHVAATPVMQVLAPDGSILLPFGYHTDFSELVLGTPVYGDFTGSLFGCPPGSVGAAPPFERIPRDYRGRTAFLLPEGMEHEELASQAGALLIVAKDPRLVERKHLYGSYGFANPRDYPVAVAVTPEAAVRICQAAGASDPNALSPLQIHLDIPVEGENLDEVYYDVIGYLPGTGSLTRTEAGVPLDKHIIMISAYYDGLGLGVEGGMYPGANDNASGVATLLEMARLLKTTEFAPEKTVVFVAWSGAERAEGLSTFKVVNARAGYSDMILEAVIELSGTGGGTGEGVAIGQGTSFRLTRLIEEAARRVGVSVTTRGRGPHFGMDYASAFGGRTALSAFLSWDGSDEVAHTVLDSSDKLDAAKTERLGRLATLVALVLTRETTY
jgi:ABC-type dipeptide/oligopeptide/nickel transport system permease component